MKSQNSHIVLDFACKQDWNEMRFQGGHRFCDRCSHVVYDLRNKSAEEIAALASGGKICGRVDIKQLEPDLIPLRFPKFGLPVRIAATLIGLAGIMNEKAAAQTSAAIIEVNQNAVTPVPATEIQAVPEPSEPLIEDVIANSEYAAKPKYYLSWRWPFVHKRQSSSRMGNIRVL
jgi:hypothetical protein